MQSTTAIADEIAAAVEGQTVARLFVRAVNDYADQTALQLPDGGALSYAELGERVARVAAGLGARGVGPGSRVMLMMRNRAEFHILDLAVLFCGATPISIYNSSSVEQVTYLVNHSQACLAIVEDAGYLATFALGRGDMPDLQGIIVIESEGVDVDPADTYAALFDNEPVDLAVAADLSSPEDLATVIYTSGTTGLPKGVMLSNFNLCWTIESLRRSLELDPAPWRVVSYLPMAHIAERMVSHYQAIAMGFAVTPLADVGKLAPTLAEVRPQMFFGVPRVYEKIQSGVVAALSANPEQAKQFADGVEAAIPIAGRRAWGTSTAEDEATWDVLDGVAFAPIRQLLGFDELVVAVTGAAPMSPELLSWYRGVGVPLAEIYGMSESSGPMNFAPYRVKPGTVGPAIPGEECRIADDGEVLVRGGNVFVGYLGDPEKTAEALDADGWLHSGDIGTMDEDGYVRIVDRKKELIITAGGKNISPANLEAALKNIPLVGQACAIGDKRPFVSALLTLDPDVAPVWGAEHGLGTDLAVLAAAPEVRAEIEAGLAHAMEPFNHAEQVKKFTLLADEWLPDTDLLTPTSKLKRRGVHARYADAIEAMYS
jgi:long-chain acyl-CoA synthetase